MKRIALALLAVFALIIAAGCSSGNNQQGDAGDYATLIFDASGISIVDMGSLEDLL